MKLGDSSAPGSPADNSKKSRARRESGFAVKAQFVARNLVIESGQLPTQRALRTLVGGGSTRDIVAAIAAARLYLAAKATLQTSEIDADKVAMALRERIIHLEAENAFLRDQDVAREERMRGLERHLLLETARMRDQLAVEAQAQAHANGSIDRRTLLRPATRAVMTPVSDERIME